jgi:hypothetical protein
MLNKPSLLATLVLSLSASAGWSAEAPPAPRTTPEARTTPRPAPTATPTREATAEESKLAEAYRLLSKFRDVDARRLIDEALRSYETSGDLEGLAMAYTVSADYYRYVRNERYQKHAAQDKVEPGSVEPFPLHVILMAPVDERTAQESRKAEDTYRKVIEAALAKKDPWKASENSYRLAVLFMRSQRPKDACQALDDTLAQFNLGYKLDPKREMVWNRMRYPSYPDQIVDTKKHSGCEALSKEKDKEPPPAPASRPVPKS